MEHRKQYDNKIVLSRTEEHKIPKGKMGLVFCKICNAVYYKKSWHKNLRNYKNFREDSPINFSVCPACKMMENKQFEGEIIIYNTPEKISDNLIHLIESFGHRAYDRDPMHRVIGIKKTRESIIVTTTENQLAVKLAKKIKEVFKSASWRTEIKISYSSAPSDVVYIKLRFNSEF
ncbi:hypothetical protein HZB04_00850 [Candidatus Wolfebacteria bacterium]|nr:hypothetical protein [Candidatus Wolfebacteria bacterium]